MVMRFTSILYEEAKKKGVLVENILIPIDENAVEGTMMALLKDGSLITTQYNLVWNGSEFQITYYQTTDKESIVFSDTTDIRSIFTTLSILVTSVQRLNKEYDPETIARWEGIITKKGGSLKNLRFNTLPSNIQEDTDYVNQATTPIELFIGIDLGYGVSLDFQIDLNTVLVEGSDVQFRAYGVDLGGQLTMIHANEDMVKSQMKELENYLKNCGSSIIKDVILPYYNDELMGINFRVHAV